jgi:hypothetical protein
VTSSIRAVVLLALCAAVAEAQTGDAPEAAPANDVFRHAPSAGLGSTDTSTAGTDLFRRASVRSEMVGHGAAAADSVVIDGAKVPLDTVRADAVVARDDITEHLARPVKARPAAPSPAPPPATPPTVAVAPPAPAVVTPPPAPVAVAAPAPVAPPKPVPAPVVAVAPARTPPPVPKSTPTVKAPPPTDSAQLVREVAELQRDVAPKLHTVGVQIDSVKEAYQASLDRLAREAPLPDTMEQRMLQATIAAARFKNDTTTAASTSPTSKKKKAKVQSGN